MFSPLCPATRLPQVGGVARARVGEGWEGAPPSGRRPRRGAAEGSQRAAGRASGPQGACVRVRVREGAGPGRGPREAHVLPPGAARAGTASGWRPWEARAGSAAWAMEPGCRPQVSALWEAESDRTERTVLCIYLFIHSFRSGSGTSNSNVVLCGTGCFPLLTPREQWKANTMES